MNQNFLMTIIGIAFIVFLVMVVIGLAMGGWALFKKATVNR